MHDLGKEFVNEILQNLEALTGVKDLKTTSYRPSSNGALERAHASINSVFAKTINANMKNWNEDREGTVVTNLRHKLALDKAEMHQKALDLNPFVFESG